MGAFIFILASLFGFLSFFLFLLFSFLSHSLSISIFIYGTVKKENAVLNEISEGEKKSMFKPTSHVRIRLSEEKGKNSCNPRG